MATIRAPKQWCLTKEETINTFESWRQNLQYILSLDTSFAPFLVDGVTWQKKKQDYTKQGLTDDADTVAEAIRKTAAQKITQLELMLGQIANYCPIISRNSIIKNSVSLNSIWQLIRAHFGFQSTGAHFIDFIHIKLGPSERPEDLYQRLMAFTEDNMLHQGGGISHHGTPPAEDEEMSPSLENLVVLMWLHLIHPDLPNLVKQRYGTELRTRTLATLKTEISQAMDSLLETVRSSEDSRVMRSAVSSFKMNDSRFQSTKRRTSTSYKSCPLCKVANRPSSHYLSQCNFLPATDKKFLSRARLISTLDLTSDVEDNLEGETVPEQCDVAPLHTRHTTITNRVQINQSPSLPMYFRHHPVNLTLDSGAETNMVKESIARSIGAIIKPSTQSALQADGRSPLKIFWETKLHLQRDNRTFALDALVVENIDVDILAGVPFMVDNDITLRPAKYEITFSDGKSYHYCHQNRNKNNNSTHMIRKTNAHILRAPSSNVTIWPGDFLEIDIPPEYNNVDIAVEPRLQKPSVRDWPTPFVVTPICGKIRIPNVTTQPVVLHKHEHFGQLQHTVDPPPSLHISVPVNQPATHISPHFSSDIKLDPDKIMPPDIRSQFNNLHDEYDHVFDPAIKRYNGSAGPVTAVVNMGPTLPPQRKGRVPQYSRDKLEELQRKFDELENAGVFSPPEDAGVVVEYVNPSFLINKPSGGYRLVTSFGEVAKYSKPQPALLPDVDSTLRTIARWKYLIVTDLSNAYYQIPLATESMKFCGVCTPFRGVRVYTRGAMGMPGSETALEQLTCRIFGHLIAEAKTAKLADDLFIGGQTFLELYENWQQVLLACKNANIGLSARKTTIAPTSTTILGWIWSHGKLAASPHRIATLSSCSLPLTVKAMRSFIGAYKFLARVIPNSSQVLAPLEAYAAGKPSQEKLKRDDQLLGHFQKAQTYLSSHKAITIPRPSDRIWIVTDGAVKNHGLGSTMYVTRNGQLYLAGFFSAKLRQRQETWIPCEIEALCIAASLKHFSPYISQATQRTCILTDSKPCVQAFEKLCRGEFSHSSRVVTFLSIASRFPLSIRHLAGSVNLPSDFACRNAPVCDRPDCQICSFINQLETSSVRHTSVQDVVSGNVRMPFTTRSTWLSTQNECPDLRRVRAHLQQGTRPSKKLTNCKDVKRYLNVCTLSKDGLLVVQQIQPFSSTDDKIVVPRQILPGLLTALHIRLDHPTNFQQKQVVSRYFYALDLEKSLLEVSKTCHTCASLAKLTQQPPPPTTSIPPPVVGSSFAADVIKSNRQLILLLRETVTSYTTACLIDSESAESLRSGLIRLCIELRPLDGPPAIVRVDAAPGFTRLLHDKQLASLRITIEIGRIKNRNKNPVAEKAVQELQDEFMRQDPEHTSLSPCQLAIAVSSLNSRIRNQGLSSRELWTQRDQFNHHQIPLHDRQYIAQQHKNRLTSHAYDRISSAAKHSRNIQLGDLVYLYNDKNKNHSRSRYLVSDIEDQWFFIRKFTGNQLRNQAYKVHHTECFKVPTSLPSSSSPPHDLTRFTNTSDEEFEPPAIPTEISTPILQYPSPHPVEQHRDPPELTPQESQILPAITPDLPPAPPGITHEPPEPVVQHHPRRSERKRVIPARLQNDFELY
jgi:hypothetical protein